MFQCELSWVADVPLGFSSVKSVYADLKAFQVHMHDTGNSQVTGEQLHKSSIGTKEKVFFLSRVPVTFGISRICQRIYEILLNNCIYVPCSYVVNISQKNILSFLLLKCFGVSATRCFIALCGTKSFFKHHTA